MMMTSILFFKRLVTGYLEIRRRGDANYRTWLIILSGLLVVCYQASRLAGTVLQMRRGQINGACLSAIPMIRDTYELHPTPFNRDCLNPNDYVFLVSSALSILITIILFIDFMYEKIQKLKENRVRTE